MVESMACGTPVIAFARGSIPEIVRHGETGYVVEDIEDAADAVATIRSIDRSVCREDVERRFTSTRMARDYVRVYREILNEDARDDR
jgi:glycosyltransferase involved in cell wall biosynthesis